MELFCCFLGGNAAEPKNFGEFANRVYSDIKTEYVKAHKDRGAFFSVRDLLTVVEMKYLTPEGRNLLDTVMSFVVPDPKKEPQPTRAPKAPLAPAAEE